MSEENGNLKDIKKHEDCNDEIQAEEKREKFTRLSKRLAYLLRYGACKEGLVVDDNGYVNLNDLMTVNLLHDYTREDVLEAIKTSVSYKKKQRYEWREREGAVYIRAAYLRNFEKNPFHFGTKVKTLFETATTYIIDNLDNFDLQDFPDEHILRDMMRRLKRQKKLSHKALQTLLAPTVTRLDLEGVYLTNKTLATIWTQCPDLVAVSLKDCGYIMTDTVLNKFTQNLPQLERLNLCSCTHLSSKCLAILSKNLTKLKVLHIGNISSLTYTAVLNFMTSVKALTFLDVYCLKTTLEEYRTLTQLAKKQELELILKEPRHKSETAEVKEEEIEATLSSELWDSDHEEQTL
ncbi:hypothetical protein BgiBS90_032701 [Biomphalaria glabrata]|nr:hypothetical protein BgiBS90_032701 [Biomphalaria glabrata]